MWNVKKYTSTRVASTSLLKTKLEVGVALEDLHAEDHD
jgi:hypothetical protein